MAKLDPRRALDELIKERGESYSSVSRLLSRNPAYIQQFIKRGSPTRLDDSDIEPPHALGAEPPAYVLGVTRPDGGDPIVLLEIHLLLANR